MLPWKDDIIQRLVVLLREGWDFKAHGDFVTITKDPGWVGNRAPLLGEFKSLREAVEFAEWAKAHRAKDAAKQAKNEAILAKARALAEAP